VPIPRSALHDVEYWLKRAEEARTFADEMRDPETKSLMLGIAESYERIAKAYEKIADYQKHSRE
jgi:DNA-binding ferritin-like protein